MRGAKKAPARGPRPATARGAATRARIVEAAANLVYRRGPAATSLEDIMDATATSKSQLYHYFADKDALMRAVIEFQTARVTGGDAVRPEALDSLDGLRRWRNAVVMMNRSARGVGGCPLGSLVGQLADRSESARALLGNGFELWESRFRQGLAAMRDRGELKPEADPAELATAMIAALQGGLLLAQTMRTSRALELALDMAIGHIARLSA